MANKAVADCRYGCFLQEQNGEVAEHDDKQVNNPKKKSKTKDKEDLPPPQLR